MSHERRASGSTRRAWSASATGDRTCCACWPRRPTSRSTGSATSTRERLARFAPALSAARPTTPTSSDVLDDPDGRRGRHRDAGVHPLRPRRRAASPPASTPSSRSRSRLRRELADELHRARRRRTDRVLMCGHTFIYSPPSARSKRMLDAATLGDIFFISSSRVNLGLHQRDVSVIWDLGPHDFSILLYWLGRGAGQRRARSGATRSCPGIPDVAFVDADLRLGRSSPTSS